MQGEPVIYTPGPKKILPLHLEKLCDEIFLLSHARERSQGAAFYTRYRDQLSRRRYEGILELVRQEVNRGRKAVLSQKIIEPIEVQGPRQVQVAWRVAVETWLRRNGIINVVSLQQCYPIFLKIMPL